MNCVRQHMLYTLRSRTLRHGKSQLAGGSACISLPSLRLKIDYFATHLSVSKCQMPETSQNERSLVSWRLTTQKVSRTMRATWRKIYVFDVINQLKLDTVNEAQFDVRIMKVRCVSAVNFASRWVTKKIYRLRKKAVDFDRRA